MSLNFSSVATMTDKIKFAFQIIHFEKLTRTDTKWFQAKQWFQAKHGTPYTAFGNYLIRKFD